MGAYYDPRTDRIVGAKRGTWAYAHEERHRWQFKNFKNLERNVTMVHITSYYGAIIAGAVLWIGYGFSWAIFGMGLGMAPHVVFTALIEADAYLMGSINHWRSKR